jgi:hypothetical protein
MASERSILPRPAAPPAAPGDAELVISMANACRWRMRSRLFLGDPKRWLVTLSVVGLALTCGVAQPQEHSADLKSSPLEKIQKDQAATTEEHGREASPPGQSIMIVGKSYKTTWQAALKVLGRHFDVLEQNPASGIIRASASYGPQAEVHITPSAGSTTAHSISIAGRNTAGANSTDRSLEQRLDQEIQEMLIEEGTITITDALGFLQKLITTAGIVLGGVWTYFLFIRNRTLKPRIVQRVGGRLSTTPHGHYILVTVSIANKGGVAFYPDIKNSKVIVSAGVRRGMKSEWVEFSMVEVFSEERILEPGAEAEDQQVVHLAARPRLPLRLEFSLLGTTWVRKEAPVWTAYCVVLPDAAEKSTEDNPDGV